ncbi:MAG TPA: TadE/TadG family type IV pilus assembly protein [Gemmatimonadota bacterium]
MLRSTRGLALAEFAIVLPLLLMLVLGVIEYGNVLSRMHTLSSLSREGANLASRGSTLPEVLTNVLTNGADIALASRGGVVASRLQVQGGAARVLEQSASAGFGGRSLIGGAGGPAAGTGTWGLAEGQVVYVVEIFYNYSRITPLQDVLGIRPPATLYERATF